MSGPRITRRLGGGDGSDPGAPVASSGGYSVVPAVGKYAGVGGQSTTLTHFFPVGYVWAQPVILDPGSWDAMSWWTKTTGVEVWRLGLFPASPDTGMPNGMPVKHDFGTINHTVAGVGHALGDVEIEERGLYWLTGRIDSSSSSPSTVCLQFDSIPAVQYPAQMSAGGDNGFNCITSPTSGPYGSFTTFPAGAIPDVAYVPKLTIRRA